MTNKEKLFNFGSKLKALGGRLDYPDIFQNQYIDIEEFFLEATLFVSKDSRILATVDNWLHTFGFIISPSKLKRLIKEGKEYEPAVLGAFLEVIKHNKFKKINTNCLNEFISPRKKVKQLLDDTIIPVEKDNSDKLWAQFNLIKINYNENKKKYLLPIKAILKRSPEINYRVNGLSITEADYRSFLDKEKNDFSLNEISQRIHSHYPTVHQISSRLEAFKIAN